jgi:hypothetical protein
MALSKTGAPIFAVLLLVGPYGASACEVPAREEGDRHLLLVVDRGPSGFRIDEVHVVATPLPTTRAPRLFRWRAEITDGAGRPLFSDAIPESGIRRGAFANADGTTESVHVERETSTFALRLPLVRGGANVRFVDTSPDEPPGALPLAPVEVELGVVPYPADAR